MCPDFWMFLFEKQFCYLSTFLNLLKCSPFVLWDFCKLFGGLGTHCGHMLYAMHFLQMMKKNLRKSWADVLGWGFCLLEIVFVFVSAIYKSLLPHTRQMQLKDTIFAGIEIVFLTDINIHRICAYIPNLNAQNCDII